jgi:hypothetical protein
MENLIDHLKLYTRSDKTACHRWQTNQFRQFLHQGAYWLLHSMWMAAPRRSRWRGATLATIRTLLLKIACRLEELRTRIKLSFPAYLRHADALTLITGQLCPQAPRMTRPYSPREPVPLTLTRHESVPILIRRQPGLGRVSSRQPRHVTKLGE